MGAIFHNARSHIDTIEPGSVFVEIGSDRYEGSTEELDRLAGLHGTKLVTVDIMPDASQRLGNRLTNTEFVVASGNTWAAGYNGPPIACLYLDNFDYIWEINNIDQRIRTQINFYKGQGLALTNQNCQIEHMTQMLCLYPHLTRTATVIFDDTYLSNDCWVGKCGPAVVYLLAQGWNIVERTTDCGIILQRLDKS